MIKNEIKEATENVLTASQRFKYELLKWCGNVNEAISSYDFIMSYKEPKTTASEEPKDEVSDDIYYVMADGRKIPVSSKPEASTLAECIGIGIKSGDKKLIVAIEDEAGGDEITLTSGRDNTGNCDYKPRYADAISDFQGKQNTEHLKQVGLNERIQLKENWYIPSLGEMYLILFNLKYINDALEYAGKSPLARCDYWTSTEASAERAWYLYLTSGGYASYGTKATYQRHVRAVSAFK